MIIENICFETTEWHSFNKSWSTTEAVKIEFHCPSKTKITLTGFVMLPFAKAKNMSLEQLNDYVKEKIRKQAEELEE